MWITSSEIDFHIKELSISNKTLQDENAIRTKIECKIINCRYIRTKIASDRLLNIHFVGVNILCTLPYIRLSNMDGLL